MAFIFPKAREAFEGGLLNWGTGTGGDDIRVTYVTSGYAPASTTTDEFLSAISGFEGTSCRSPSFTGKSHTNGVLDADDPTSPTVPVQSPLNAAIIFKHTGSDATARMIAYIDNAVGFPYTPTGVDMILRFADDANKIAKL